MYRLSRDGEAYSTFHKYCDHKGPTLVLTKLIDGDILGTYTPLDWDSKTNGWKTDPNIFVFSLTENKRCMKSNKDNLGIYCREDCGPCSGLVFDSSKTMKQPYLFLDKNRYLSDPQMLIPLKQGRQFYKADEVEVFKIIIG